MALKLKRTIVEDYCSEQTKAKKHTILLVDDEEANLQGLARILEADYNILTANDGITALEVVKSISPPDFIHLIISDQRMPQMTGVEFLEKSLVLSPDSLRILLTGFTDINAIIDSINRGSVYKFLTKPIEPNELRLTIQRTLESLELSKANQQLVIELQELNASLEQKVTERSQRLIESEKMTALGQLIAGIAHEINTPLGAINSSSCSMEDMLAQIFTLMPNLFQSCSHNDCQDFLWVLNKSLNSNNEILLAKELRQKRRELISQFDNEIEDIDSIADTLVDMGIYENVEIINKLLKRSKGREIVELVYKLSELKKGTQNIKQATERAAKVVFALKSYAHQNDSSQKVSADIIQGIETILTLYQSQIRQGIELVKNYADNLPEIKCYPDELNQVWTNLIHNALQAMDFKGILTINVEQSGDYLKISIQDNGKGIAPENRTKIFDAFFTTKPAGEGTGLGLHIIKKIIDKHSGSINVESQAGCTVFTVLLPIH